LTIELSASALIGTAIVHGGAIIWKLSNLDARVEASEARLKRIENKLFNGSEIAD
jgi:hypothetical protein